MTKRKRADRCELSPRWIQEQLWYCIKLHASDDGDYAGRRRCGNNQTLQLDPRASDFFTRSVKEWNRRQGERADAKRDRQAGWKQGTYDGQNLLHVTLRLVAATGTISYWSF